MSKTVEVLIGKMPVPIIPFFTVKAFADKYKSKLSVMNGGEHWAHTKSQISHLKMLFNTN